MEKFTQFNIERLLVPLDGSRLAESTLPSAGRIASRFDAKIILLHVREQNPPATVHGEKHLSDTKEANQYLQSIAKSLNAEGVETEWHVHDSMEGDVARSIVEHANEFLPDMVILCTHGRGGMRDLLYGNIAQQALNRGKWPILLIQPDETGKAPDFNLQNVLLPIEQDHTHDTTLAVATAMCMKFSATLRLLVVVPTLETLSGEKSVPGSLLPVTTRAILDIAEQEGRELVEKMGRSQRFDGINICTEILRGDPVQAVLDYSIHSNSDLMLLSSHARIGLSALFSGSFTSRITPRVKCPLLLVRL